VLARLAGVGAEIGFGDRLRMTLGDILGLGGSYGLVIGIALALGFVVAWVVKRFVKRLAPDRLPARGRGGDRHRPDADAHAIRHDPHRRGPRAAGLRAQCLAGALAGFVFALLSRPRAAYDQS
jgi:hypothetical protein